MAKKIVYQANLKGSYRFFWRKLLWCFGIPILKQLLVAINFRFPNTHKAQ